MPEEGQPGSSGRDTNRRRYFTDPAGLGDGRERVESIEGLLERYERERVTGDGFVDYDDPHIEALVSDLDDTVASRLDAVVDEPDDRIWPDHPLGRGHPEAEEPWRELQRSYGKFRPLAEAYVTPASEYEGDERLVDAVEHGFEFLAEYFSPGQDTYGNWWQWEIGIPDRVLDTLVLVADELPGDLVEHHTNAVEYHVGEPDIGQGAGDLLSKADRWVRRGMVEDDADVIREGRDPIANTLEHSEQNNVSPDGSALHHGNIPYNLHYTRRFLCEIASIAHLLRGSPWSLTREEFPGNLDILAEWAYEVFEPLVWRGQAMSMVLGRHQKHDTERSHGQDLVVPFVRLGGILPDPDGTVFRRIAKGWIERDSYGSLREETTSIPTYALVSELLTDESIPPREPLQRYKQYYNMDRAVYRTASFAVGLAMLSERTGNYEVLHDGRGPQRGWFTSHGMTYVYTDDLAQYNDAYWHTVDPTCLPGTTVNPSTTADISAGRPGQSAHAGGVEFDDRFGSSSTVLVPAAGVDEEALCARKSWFCFDDSVLALGSGITGRSDGDDVTTTVANRNLGDEDRAELVIDGVGGPQRAPADEEREGVDWIQIDRPVESIGYAFPDAPAVRVVREENDSGDPDTGTRDHSGDVTRYYAKLLLEHGADPDGAGYVYAVLPGASAEQTAAFAADPPVDVLERSPAVHAVRHTERSLTGVQAFESATVGETGVSVDGPAALTYSETDELTVAVADPTQQRSGIEVEIPATVTAAQSIDDELSVLATDPLRLSANTDELSEPVRGRTLTATFGLDSD